MAESKNNIVTHGISGKLGDLIVLRQKAGKTFVGKAPHEMTGEPTEAQKEIQSRFQQAILYGKAAIADPTIKKEYHKAAGPGQSAFNVAVADFFHAPAV